MTGVSFVMIVFIIARKLLFGDPVAGWLSLACIIVFLGGIELLAAKGSWDSIWQRPTWR